MDELAAMISVYGGKVSQAPFFAALSSRQAFKDAISGQRK